MLVGVLAVLGDKKAMAAAATGDVWVVYPLNPAPGQAWMFWAWAVLGLVGMSPSSSGGRAARRGGK